MDSFNMEMENLICLSFGKESADPEGDVLIEEHFFIDKEQNNWLNNDALW